MKNNSLKNGKKKEIIEKYNITSYFYEDRYIKIQNDKYLLISENFELDEKVILDAGCGTGLLYEFILKKYPLQEISNYLYVGIDISINMLKLFESKLIQRDKKVALILTDLEYLPIRDKVFNQIFSITSLQNLPDMMLGLQETFRVIKRDGNIRISILKKKLDLSQILSILESCMQDTIVIDKKEIEDIIVIGKLKEGGRNKIYLV